MVLTSLDGQMHPNSAKCCCDDYVLLIARRRDKNEKKQEGHDGPGSLTESFSLQIYSTSLFLWFQLVTPGMGPVLILRGIM